MTNAELIQKIRAEIERQMNFYDGKEREVLDDPKQFTYALLYQGHQRMCAKLLSFLSTLESEKPMNQDELEKEIERCVIEPYYDLDGVAVKGATAYITVNDVADIARHFAQWGYLRAAEKYDEIEYNQQRAEEECLASTGKTSSGSSEIPNDLEEYASGAGFDYVDNIVQEHPGHRFNDHDVEFAYRDGIIAGAKWQAEQDKETIELAEDHAYLAGAVNEREKMLKEVVEGEVCIPNVWVEHKEGKELVVRAEISKELGFKFGDKVRVIVMKKED